MRTLYFCPVVSFLFYLPSICKIHFASKSCVLLFWQRYCTALEQWAWGKLCGVVLGMKLRNLRRGHHLYSAGRPSRWASAHILVCAGFCFFSTVPKDFLGRTSPKWPVLCRVGCKTLNQSIYLMHIIMLWLLDELLTLVIFHPVIRRCSPFLPTLLLLLVSERARAVDC